MNINPIYREQSTIMSNTGTCLCRAFCSAANIEKNHKRSVHITSSLLCENYLSQKSTLAVGPVKLGIIGVMKARRSLCENPNPIIFVENNEVLCRHIGLIEGPHNFIRVDFSK